MAKEKKMTVQEFARMGGKSTLKKYGKEHFAKIAKASHIARKKNAKASSK